MKYSTQKEALINSKDFNELESADLLVKNIAQGMFNDNSDYLKRLYCFGKKLSRKTIIQKKMYINLIIDDFGDCNIKDLTVIDVEKRLLDDEKHSASWKNMYLETIGCIYDEAKWKCKINIEKPVFQRFIRHSKKADIFTKEELNIFFNIDLWKKYQDEYLLFLIMISCGLRLGEARGLRVKQFLFEDNALVVDGFCEFDGHRTNYNKKGSDEDRKTRVSIVPKFTMDLVKKYIKYKNIAGEDFLFLWKDKNIPFTTDHLNYIFKKLLKLCGIDTTNRKLITHSCRFTYVTRMRRELDAEQVKKLVGHTSIEMTEYYTRFAIPELIESLKDVFEVANRLFE